MELEIRDNREKPIEIALGEYLVEKGITSLEQLSEVLEHPYILIPLDMARRTDLNGNQKLLLGELQMLARKKGYCFATNEYLGNLMGLSNRYISEILSSLHALSLIKVAIIRNSGGTFRKVFMGDTANDVGGVAESPQRGYGDSSTQNRNRQIEIDKENIPSVSAKPPVSSVDNIEEPRYVTSKDEEFEDEIEARGYDKRDASAILSWAKEVKGARFPEFIVQRKKINQMLKAKYTLQEIIDCWEWCEKQDWIDRIDFKVVANQIGKVKVKKAPRTIKIS